jgi:hypothetical protein
MVQTIITYCLLGVAISYLVYKYILPKKKKDCGDGDCGCH